MSLLLEHPHTEVAKAIAFLKQTFQVQEKQKAVIAVSGGIDSALSLTLLAHALPKEDIYPILLPYGDQSVEDSQAVCEFNGIPKGNVMVVNIKNIVDSLAEEAESRFSAKGGLSRGNDDTKGNIMARVRMIFIYDLAKKLDALVVGTENKSEKHLAYFTRFGDEASDIEPIQHLYKTQVRQLAKHLHVPEVIVAKAPSAGLWQGQTDEEELGFSYEQADKVMFQLIDQEKEEQFINLEGEGGGEVVKKVLARIKSQQFKHEVPYHLQ